MRHCVVELIHVCCKRGETLLHRLRGCKLLLEQWKVSIYPLVYLSLWKRLVHDLQKPNAGRSLDSRMAWSNSATQDAATSAFRDFELAEDIFERISDEASSGAALRGKWEGTGNAMDHAFHPRAAGLASGNFAPRAVNRVDNHDAFRSDVSYSTILERSEQAI